MHCAALHAQTTTWTYDGNGNWSTPSNWDNGAPGAGSLVVIDEGDWPVDVVLDINPPHPISGLTLGSDDGLSMQNLTLPFNIGSTITNDGEIRQLALISSASVMRFLGDATVTGSGVWSLSNMTFNSIEGVNPGTGVLTQEAGHTIHGGGTIGNLKMGLINHGTVEADFYYWSNDVPLYIRPGTGVDINGTDVDVMNDGVFRASNGGRLILRDGVFDNAGGTVEALGADSWVIIEDAELRNGELVTDTDGRIAPSNGGLLRDVTLTAGSTMRINNINAALAGTLTNNGTVEQVSGTFSVSSVSLQGDVTLDGTGTWQTTNNSLNRIAGLGTNVLTNGPDHTIRGTPAIGNNSLGLINYGAIIADQPYAANASPLTIAPGTGVNINGKPIDASNYGTLRSENAAILRIQNGDFENLGTVEALNASHVEIDGANGAVTLNNDAGALTGGTWRAISTGSGALLQLSGANITRIADNTTVELGGPGSVIRVNSTPIANTLTQNDGTLLLTGGHALTLANALDNAGLLLIDALSSLDLGANDLDNSGTLALAVDGVPASPEPAVTFTGLAQLAGTLVVTLEGGYTPVIGDTILLLDASGVTGAFSQAQLQPFLATPMTSLGLEYTSTGLYLKAGLTGDLNGDGFVGIGDLNIVLGSWNGGVTAGVWSTGDTSGDGFIGIDDLNAVLGNWNAGTPPDALATVPEPATLLSVILLLAIGADRRHR